MERLVVTGTDSQGNQVTATLDVSTDGQVLNALANPSAYGWPDATNTGLARWPGVSLLPVYGDLTVSDTTVKENGVTKASRPTSGSAVWGPVTLYPDRTVIDRAHVVSGRLQRKSNYPVFCDRSKIHGAPQGVNAYYTIDGTSNTGMMTLTDCEVDGQQGNVAVAWSYYRLINCDIRGGLDNVRLGQQTHLADCYAHHLTRVEGSHNDTLQLVNGSYSSVTHCTLLAYRADTDDPMNAVFQLGNLSGPVDDVLIDDNLCDGGNYTFNANWSSGQPATNIRITRNRFGRNFRYGPVATIYPHPGVTWAGNVWDDTGSGL